MSGIEIKLPETAAKQFFLNKKPCFGQSFGIQFR